jgi:hypothetical protein
MAVLEVAKVLLGIAQLYGKLTEDRGGDNAARAASAALVGAVMHHAAFDLVAELKRRGVHGAVSSTRTKFKVEIAAGTVEVEAVGDGLLLFFGGEDDIRLVDRFQHVPVAAIAFDDAARMGRELLGRVAEMLELTSSSTSPSPSASASSPSSSSPSSSSPASSS